MNQTAKDEFLKPIKPLLDRFEVFGSPDYTYHRVFVVRERERVYGADQEHSYDGSIFISHDGEVSFESEYEFNQYLLSDDFDDQEYSEDDFYKVFYHNVNMIKKVFFTRQAAEEYFFSLSKEKQKNHYLDEEPAEKYGHEILAICEMLNQLKELQQ